MWLRRGLKGTAAAAVIASSAAAIRYRPLADNSYDEVPSSRHYEEWYLERRGGGTGARRVDLREDDMAWAASRAATMAFGAMVCKGAMSVCNTTSVVQGPEHAEWLRAVRGERGEGVPLITVANHETCFDDPGMMAALVPWDVVADPRRMRWGICTQDICFPESTLVQTLAGAGQALPIRRGGGIDQPLLLDVARHVAAGHWVHVFPEGRVIQSGALGLDVLTPRCPKQLKDIGRLKWGVGKLIAHAPVPPVVIPLHHSGMPHVMPQHNVWREGRHGDMWYDNRPLSLIPQCGNEVTVRFGGRVVYEDLIREYEAKHGALRKVSCKPADLQDSWSMWISTTRAERELYSKITVRVQEALLKLEDEAKGEHGRGGG